jgi:excisionase family DNA binding protein
MTVRELSEYLRLDRMTIYKMLKEGSIPASRIGHQWRFFRSDIDEWIRSLRSGHRLSILVVDGDSGVRQLFEAELSSDGFDVVATSGGEEALALASQRQFDVVFLELKKAAIEVFRRLRALDGSLPVVAIASSSDGRLVDQAMEVGAFTLMKKPASAADVKAILSSLPPRRGFNSRPHENPQISQMTQIGLIPRRERGERRD